MRSRAVLCFTVSIFYQRRLQLRVLKRCPLTIRPYNLEALETRGSATFGADAVGRQCCEPGDDVTRHSSWFSIATAGEYITSRTRMHPSSSPQLHSYRLQTFTSSPVSWLISVPLGCPSGILLQPRPHLGKVMNCRKEEPRRCRLTKIYNMRSNNGTIDFCLSLYSRGSIHSSALGFLGR